MIVGFNIKSVSAERKNVPKGRIDINSTPKIVSVNWPDIKVFTEKRPVNIEFEFTTKYEPDIAEIKICGYVLYLSKKNKDLIKKWEKFRTFPKEVDIEVKNFLFRKCLTLGVNLSENMQLPPPLIFPRVVQKKEGGDLTYIG
jgi:hypothetical protein